MARLLLIFMREKLLQSVFTASLLLLVLTACHREDVAQRSMAKPMTTGPIVYVALGDSTGSGVGARNGGYVVRLFNRLLQRRAGSTLTNLCVSGATTDDLVRGQLERGAAMNPDLVTVGIGINDIGHGLTIDQFAKNYEEILSSLRQKTRAQIVVTNIPDISSAPRIPGPMRSGYQQQIIRFNTRLEQIAKRHGVTIFDMYAVSKDELPSHPEYFSSDGFHPSDKGYELWATQMWPTVARAIGD
ncbi:MAG TPA: SGNH/GDSL hydrolase family protein [Pyrinomonadaceae bacterium]|nr:SGNH/GDSL hydrolase family protein [Pyrinomonadaceae bacterium]